MHKPKPRRRRKAKPTPEDVVNRLATRNAPNTLATWLEDLAEWLGMVSNSILTPQDMDAGQGRDLYMSEYVNALVIRVKVCWAFAIGYPDDLRAKVKAALSPLAKALNDIVMNHKRDIAKAKLMGVGYADMVLNRLLALHREHGPAICILADAAMDHDMTFGQPDLPVGLDNLNESMTLEALGRRLERLPPPGVWSRPMARAVAARLCERHFKTLMDNIPHLRNTPAGRLWRFDIGAIEAQFGRRIANKMRENTK